MRTAMIGSCPGKAHYRCSCILMVLGAGGVRHVGPIVTAIMAILIVVQFSYRQTFAAYPGGGGSYTVAHENLGPRAGL